MKRIVTPIPVSLKVIYYRLDFPSILQEFFWNYDDIVPELIRTHKFLNHWHQNIKTPISEVLINVNDGYRQNWRPIQHYIELN